MSQPDLTAQALHPVPQGGILLDAFDIEYFWNSPSTSRIIFSLSRSSDWQAELTERAIEYFGDREKGLRAAATVVQLEAVFESRRQVGLPRIHYWETARLIARILETPEDFPQAGLEWEVPQGTEGWRNGVAESGIEGPIEGESEMEENERDAVEDEQEQQRIDEAMERVRGWLHGIGRGRERGRGRGQSRGSESSRGRGSG